MTIRSREPSHSTRDPLIPECESAMVMAVEPVRGSNNLSFLSLQVLPLCHHISVESEKRQE